MLKAILHDWVDTEATAIPRTCRRAMGTAGTLLVIKQVVGEPNEEAATKFSDLNILVMPGGRRRTLEEFAVLFSAAGLRLASVTPTRAGWSVVEGVPA